MFWEPISIADSRFNMLKTVYHLIDHFKAGRTNVSNQKEAGRPRSGNIERAEEMIMEDRRTTVVMVSVKLVVSHRSALNILHNELGFREVSARWVPIQLKTGCLYRQSMDYQSTASATL